MKNLLKTKVVDKNGEQTVIYYDIVATDATREEKDVYYNEPLEIGSL